VFAADGAVFCGKQHGQAGLREGWDGFIRQKNQGYISKVKSN
jgi:hypothetical protein